jgi:hypothetical protein
VLSCVEVEAGEITVKCRIAARIGAAVLVAGVTTASAAPVSAQSYVSFKEITLGASAAMVEQEVRLQQVMTTQLNQLIALSNTQINEVLSTMNAVIASTGATLGQMSTIASSTSGMFSSLMSCPVLRGDGILLNEDNCLWTTATG